MVRATLLLLILSVSATAAQKWIEVTTPSFRVISDGPPGQTRRAAIAFEQMKAVLRTGTSFRQDKGEDFVVFAAADEDSMKKLLPEYWERKGSMKPGGVFHSSGDIDVAVVRLDFGDEYSLQIVYHEYIHKVIAKNFIRVPTWLNEGLAEFYANAQLEGDKAKIGRPSREVSYLRGATLIPLETLLTATFMSPHVRNEDKARLFYAESWALTHYLHFSPGMENGRKLTAYLKDLQNGDDQIKTFERNFGPIRTVQDNLQKYVMQHGMYIWSLNNPARLTNDQITVRTLEPWERDAELGLFYAMLGPKEKAESLLKSSQAEHPSAAADEAMALMYLHSARSREAEPLFKRAWETDASRYLSHYYYVLLNPLLPVEERKQHLLKAVESKPNFARALYEVSRILVDENDLQGARMYALRAIQADQSRPAYFTQVALIFEKGGDRQNAIRVADKVVHDFSGSETYTAQKILDRLRKTDAKPGDNAAQ